MKSSTLNILTVNAGSSSIKFSYYTFSDGNQVERYNEKLAGEDLNDIAERFVSTLKERALPIDYVSHRFVHGGIELYKPVELTDKVVVYLSGIMDLAPLHLPVELKILKRLTPLFPQAKHIACFDTEFHRDLPLKAQTIGLPTDIRSSEIRRYGFHGLSYEYVAKELKELETLAEKRKRVIVAHLGSGSSLAAISKGKCIDTSMGFSPLGGIMMGSRLGDIDPGLLIYLQRKEKLSIDRLEQILVNDSGLKGIGHTSDMKKLLERRAAGDKDAELAIDTFVYQVQKQIGAYAVALEGVDTLVFTGGIGENSTEVRELICSKLKVLNIICDMERNRSGENIISTDRSPVTVRIVHTNEEQILAEKAYDFSRTKLN